MEGSQCDQMSSPNKPVLAPTALVVGTIDELVITFPHTYLIPYLFFIFLNVIQYFV